MKFMLALVISCLSLSAFATPTMCATKKGVVTKVTSFLGVPITLFDLEPYQKGDFAGSPVYKVVVEDPQKMTGFVTKENKTTKLIQTQKEVKELVKEDYLIKIGSFVKLIDVSKYKTVQKAEYELVTDSITTEVGGRFKSHEELLKNYNLVPCQS